MKAYQIMNNHAKWQTLERSALDCYIAFCPATNDTDYWESRVMVEDTLNAWGIMAEAMK